MKMMMEFLPKRKRSKLPKVAINIVPGGVMVNTPGAVRAPVAALDPPKMAVVEAPPERALEPPIGIVEAPPKSKRRGGGPVTLDTCQKIVMMFEQDISQGKIAGILNISHHTSSFVINGRTTDKKSQLGPVLRQMPRAKEPTYDDYRKTLEMRAAGASYWDIVTALGVTARACDWFLRLRPVQVATLWPEASSRDEQIIVPPRLRPRGPQPRKKPPASRPAKRAKKPEAPPIIETPAATVTTPEPLPEPVVETTPVEVPLVPGKPPGLLARLWRFLAGS
jgi:hypothetical protein